MSNTIAITKIQDGPRHVRVHVYIAGDGSGDLDKYVLLDPTQDIDPEQTAVPTFTVEKILYSLSGFAAKVSFEYISTDVPLWVLTEGNESEACFKGAGGLIDRSNPLDGSGKLLLSTKGLDSAADMGTILFYLRKD